MCFRGLVADAAGEVAIVVDMGELATLTLLCHGVVYTADATDRALALIVDGNEAAMAAVVRDGGR